MICSYNVTRHAKRYELVGRRHFEKLSLEVNVASRKIEHLRMVIVNSNTPRLYSQWLNSVIYWLINHCTDWARTSVTSFGCQFEFHDVIYHIPHCNADNRRCNVVFTTT